VLFFLGGEFLFEVMEPGFGGDDQSIDDGPVGGGIEGMSGDGAADGLRGESSEGNEVVDGGGVFSSRYWSMGSESKQSRYARSWDKGGWLSRGELLKRHVDESGGSWASV